MTFHYESRSFPGETTMDFYGYTSILIISAAKTDLGGSVSPQGMGYSREHRMYRAAVGKLRSRWDFWISGCSRDDADKIPWLARAGSYMQLLQLVFISFYFLDLLSTYISDGLNKFMYHPIQVVDSKHETLCGSIDTPFSTHTHINLLVISSYIPLTIAGL